MNRKYLTRQGHNGIEPVIVEHETDEYVTYRGQKHAKHSKARQYHDDFRGATTFMRNRGEDC